MLCVYSKHVHIPSKTLPSCLLMTVRINSHSLRPSPWNGWLTLSPPAGNFNLADLELTVIKMLRRLTLRVAFFQLAIFDQDALRTILSSITSPTFCELVLEIGRLPSRFRSPPPRHMGNWEDTDQFLEDRFSKCGKFRLIIQTSELDDGEQFQQRTKETFSSLASKGCIHSETSDSIEKSLLLQEYLPPSLM